MAKFIPYSSIENSYRDKEIAYIRDLGFDKLEWVATEKVHGTNFSLWPIDGSIRPAKRSGLDDGSLYNCQIIVEELKDKVLSLGLPIYGELFGQGIQGVPYGTKRFAAFDILGVNDEFLDYDDFVSLCDSRGIDRCVEIARGSFDELLALDPNFPTKMSNCGSTHIAEGFVMKPVSTRRFGSGSRVILKKKSLGFSERSEGKKEVTKEPLTESQQVLFDQAVAYATEGRLGCVLSKLEANPPFPKVLGLFLQDIHEEIAKDCEVDASTWGSLYKQLGGVVAPLIRKSLFGG